MSSHPDLANKSNFFSNMSNTGEHNCLKLNSECWFRFKHIFSKQWHQKQELEEKLSLRISPILPVSKTNKMIRVCGVFYVSLPKSNKPITSLLNINRHKATLNYDHSG